ncbi:MAG TPA: ATP-dependent 6-phosphofructokinase [Acidimicrobiales bacterium]|nr:ATP-dependent 6-phosphofructokinase [Acidimicrobiales bacterium]
MRVGILTGGGDCPGLNAVIRAIVRKGIRVHGDELLGFEDGYQGLVDQRAVPLDIKALRGKLPIGGTILGTSRYQPFMDDDGVDRVRAAYADLGLDAVIAIGGEGTLGAARDLSDLGFPIVGVPKTIDNDMAGTEMTFGFQTAVQICTDAIDRLHTTAESPDRVMVVEVMGRHAGHIAVWSGIAGGATVTLIPEEPFDIEAVCDAIVRRHEAGRFASIVVVAEGAVPAAGTTLQIGEPETDAFGHKRLGGIGTTIGAEIERRTGFETRVTILGHIQRGGTPNAFDRVLATRYGVAAIDVVHEGRYGQMVSLHADRITTISLAEAKDRGLKTVDPELYEVAQVFFAA